MIDKIRSFFGSKEGGDKASNAYEINRIRQEGLFAQNSFCRTSASLKIDKVLADLFNLRYREKSSFLTEEILLFAAIAQGEQHHPKRILEIGTSNGINTAIISRLFPSSLVVTVNFRDDDSLDHVDCPNLFIDGRDELLSRRPNVQFIEIQSSTLQDWTEQSFDLIILNGNRFRPLLPASISSAWRLLALGGVALVDGVRKTRNPVFSGTGILASELMKALPCLQDTIDLCPLFIKNLNAAFEAYIALIQK